MSLVDCEARDEAFNYKLSNYDFLSDLYEKTEENKTFFLNEN